jgi:hypothetical protein
MDFAQELWSVEVEERTPRYDETQRATNAAGT